jgi:hypothetical protein
VIIIFLKKFGTPFLWRNRPTGAQAAPLLRILDDTHLDTHTHTLGRSPLSERSARHTDCLHAHNGRTFMLSAEFEAGMSEIKQLQAFALDCKATAIGHVSIQSRSVCLRKVRLH